VKEQKGKTDFIPVEWSGAMRCKGHKILKEKRRKTKARQGLKERVFGGEGFPLAVDRTGEGRDCVYWVRKLA